MYFLSGQIKGDRNIQLHPVWVCFSFASYKSTYKLKFNWNGIYYYLVKALHVSEWMYFQEKRHPLFSIQYEEIQEKGPALHSCILKCQDILKQSFIQGENNLVYQFDLALDNL